LFHPSFINSSYTLIHMKTLFIPAKSPVEVILPDEAVQQLASLKVGIVTTIQHLHKIHDVKQQLPNSVLAGQVLGCRADAVARLAPQLDVFLYVGSGEFHPVQVALSSNKPVFFWNPYTKTFGPLDMQFVKDYQSRVFKSLNFFYSASNVGVLVTTKRGQNNNMITSPTLANKFSPVQEILARKDGKKYYIFAFDTLSQSELENFSFIDVWVNTACSRIHDDAIPKLVNWVDIKQHEAGNAE